MVLDVGDGKEPVQLPTLNVVTVISMAPQEVERSEANTS